MGNDHSSHREKRARRQLHHHAGITSDQSSDSSKNIITMAATAGNSPGFFTGAQNTIISGSQFIEVHGNYQINNHLAANSPVDLSHTVPPLPPLRHSSTMFTGRGVYLWRLQDYFSSSTTGQKSFLLYGMGGIGKTQICLKFIEKHQNLFSDIFWIDSSSESTIDLRLRQIAQANGATAEATSSAAGALKWISQKSNWLIIYDNADGGYQMVEKFLPPGNGGNILITSRNLELMRITENSVEILEMGEEESLSLLLKSARINDTAENIQILAKQLVSKLGGIPLAIDQAGAYMMTCKCSLEDYLELYAKSQDQLMSDPSFTGASGYGSSTYSTWEISMKEIEARAASGKNMAAESAITLYKIFAFLHHENIPEELFKNAAKNYMERNINEEKKAGLPLLVTMLNAKTLFLDERGEWNQMQFHLGTQVLLSFTLIRSSGKLYSIHPLVHSWSRARMLNAEIDEKILISRALLACSVELNYHIDSYEFCALLAPHIRRNNTMLAQLCSKYTYYDDECCSFLLVFNCVGSLTEVENLSLYMIKERKERLPLDHDLVLSGMGDLGNTYGKQGRWDEAEKLQEQVVEKRKEIQGPQHLDTLRSMYNLAATYWRQGRWDEAEKLQIQVMEARKELLGPQHPDTLYSMVSLACTYDEQGKSDEAEKLHVQVLRERVEKLGSHHQDTLWSMIYLASTYHRQGRWDEAQKLEEEVMQLMDNKLGSQHPDTLWSMCVLARTYIAQENFIEAEKLQLHVAEARKAKLGPNHPDTLNSVADLAYSYLTQGKLDEAERLSLDVIEAKKEKFGPYHPDTLWSMSNLSSTYQKQGKWDDAERLDLQIIEAWKAKLGPHHPETLCSMADLATTYWMQEKRDEACSSLSQVVKLMEETMGSQHSTTVHFSNILKSYTEDIDKA